MIQGNFDFFCATGGNGAEGAGAGVTCCTGCGATTSPVVRDDGCSTRGGGGGGVTGGGGGGGGAGLEMSEVLGDEAVGPVGPVLRGNATVAG